MFQVLQVPKCLFDFSIFCKNHDARHSKNRKKNFKKKKEKRKLTTIFKVYQKFKHVLTVGT